VKRKLHSPHGVVCLPGVPNHGLQDGAKITYDIISDRGGKESAGNLLVK
jgi:hypothetical protein